MLSKCVAIPLLNLIWYKIVWFECRCWFDKSSGGFVSSCAAHIATSGSIITKINTRNMGIVTALSAGDQWGSIGTTGCKGWRQRSTVWTCTERAIWGVAHCMCSQLSVAVIVEDIARVMPVTKASYCIDRTMESRESRFNRTIAWIFVRVDIPTA